MEITLTLTTAQVAALREHMRVTAPSPSEAGLEGFAAAQLTATLDALRDRYRVNFIPLPEVMIRLTNVGKLETILSLAQVNAELGAYWEKVKAAGGIWSGSPDSLAGTAALVTNGILTQEQADALLYYPMPELPE